MPRRPTRITPVAVFSDIGRWGAVPEWLLDDPRVSAIAIRLFATLGAKYADKQTHVAYPAHTTLADDMHCSVSTIKRAVDELVQARALIVYQRTTDSGFPASNSYTLFYRNPLA